MHVSHRSMKISVASLRCAGMCIFDEISPFESLCYCKILIWAE